MEVCRGKPGMPAARRRGGGGRRRILGMRMRKTRKRGDDSEADRGFNS